MRGAGATEKKGEGVHHLAFEVTDIRKSIKEYAAMDFALVSSVPKAGADSKMICFLHPKSTNGVLLELCQSIGPLSDEYVRTD